MLEIVEPDDVGSAGLAEMALDADEMSVLPDWRILLPVALSGVYGSVMTCLVLLANLSSMFYMIAGVVGVGFVLLSLTDAPGAGSRRVSSMMTMALVEESFIEMCLTVCIWTVTTSAVPT